MSKTNYSNFSKATLEATDVEVVEIAAEQIVAETAEPVAEPAPQKEDPVKVESKVGVVSNCGRLRVRKAPSTSAEVLCEIVSLSAVVIDMSKSTEDFYKVCTEDGVEGYCMKKFITIKA